jgi:hypothetical protein
MFDHPIFHSHFKTSDIDLLLQNLVRLLGPALQDVPLFNFSQLSKVQGFLDLLCIIQCLHHEFEFILA